MSFLKRSYQSIALDDSSDTAEQPTKRPHQIRTCLICDGEKDTRAFPSAKRVSSHYHGANTCRSCYRKHLESEIDDKPWDQVSCPECDTVLAYHEVKSMTFSATHFAKYEEGSFRSALANDPDYRYCLSTECNSGQLHTGGAEQPIFRCNACGHKHCVSCEVPWHEEEACDEYQFRIQSGRDSENKQSEDTVIEISKPCPACNTRIEKNKGCDHMTCSRCRHEFCWLCSADYRRIYRDGNQAHEETCRWYRPVETPVVEPATEPARLPPPIIDTAPIRHQQMQRNTAVQVTHIPQPIFHPIQMPRFEPGDIADEAAPETPAAQDISYLHLDDFDIHAYLREDNPYGF